MRSERALAKFHLTVLLRVRAMFTQRHRNIRVHVISRTQFELFSCGHQKRSFGQVCEQPRKTSEGALAYKEGLYEVGLDMLRP